MEKYENAVVENDNSLKKISLPKNNYCKKDDFVQPTPNCYINNLSENDKLTLELLTNRTQYKKCLSLVDPDKYIETQQETIILIIKKCGHNLPIENLTIDSTGGFFAYDGSKIEY